MESRSARWARLDRFGRSTSRMAPSKSRLPTNPRLERAMAPERKSESRLIEATGKTTVALEGLKARLNREAAAPREATSEELGRQLEEYFSAAVAKSYV